MTFYVSRLVRTIYSKNMGKEKRKLGFMKKPEEPEAMPDSEKDKLFLELVDYFTRVEKRTINMVNRDLADKSILSQMVIKYLRDKKIPESLISEILQMFDAYVFGYHILEPLIDDETISDIKIISYDDIRIKRNGKRMTSDIRFKDSTEADRFVENIAIKNRVSLSDVNAMQNFTDKDSNGKFILRVVITTPFVNSEPHYYMHIRKIAKEKKDLKRLISEEMLDVKTAEYLKEKAKSASGMLFTGKGASGKTTLMNALLDCIPEDKSALVIQENEELFTKLHEDMMFQHTVENRGEGKIQYSLQDLARNGLLIDLDYFIIGEIKGGEALYFLNAAYTGHKCWASVHGVNSTEAIDKLADYVKYESDYSKEDVIRMLRTLEVVIFMEDYKVKEISEIIGFDENTRRLIYKKIL